MINFERRTVGGGGGKQLLLDKNVDSWREMYSHNCLIFYPFESLCTILFSTFPVYIFGGIMCPPPPPLPASK